MTDFQPIGAPLPNWTSPPPPARQAHRGQYCQLAPTDPDRHAASLFAGNGSDERLWTYLPYGPFASLGDYQDWMRATCTGNDPLFFTILDAKTQSALGLLSCLRIDPKNGVLEIGHLAFSPALQKTPAATESVYLLIAHAFALGYRRVEWKCDALNAPSRAAALRYGFTYEGTFRQHIIYKNRNRDTAWYAIIDTDWPRLNAAFQQWLAPANFTAEGRQLTRLSALTAAIH